MAIPIQPNSTIDYVLVADRKLPPEEQTTFEIAVVPTRLKSQVNRLASLCLAAFEKGKTEKAIDSGTASIELIRWGLRGWRNLNHPETGEPIPFETEQATVLGQKRAVPTMDTLDWIHQSWIEELLLVISGTVQLGAREGNG